MLDVMAARVPKARGQIAGTRKIAYRPFSSQWSPWFANQLLGPPETGLYMARVAGRRARAKAIVGRCIARRASRDVGYVCVGWWVRRNMEQRDGLCTVHRSIPCRIWEIVARRMA
jgi:hypothetical protein